jgi:hypothetical protein
MIRKEWDRDKTIRSMLLLTFTFFICCELSLAYASGHKDQKTAGALIGTWKSTGSLGSFTLIFKTSNQLVFEGETANYSLVQGAIRIQEEYGAVDYPFVLKGNTLIIAFPEGYQLTFTRVGKRPQEKENKGSQAGAENPSRQGANIAKSSQLTAEEVGDANWGFKFRPPEGWKYQKETGGAILGHDRIAGMILVLPHIATSFDEVRRQMTEGLSEEGTILTLSGTLQSIGNSAVAGEYSGIYEGQNVKARGIGTFSPYGGGAYIIALTIPQRYGSELRGAAEAIAKNMQYFTVEVSGLVGHFAGRWASVTSHTLANVTLSPNGDFIYHYEAGYSGEFQNELGDQTGNWGVTGQDKTRGRWTVRGNKEQGVILITYGDGSVEQVEYRVHVEKGQIYWNEYWFDGKLYSKRK